MPSSNSTVGELISRLESLLGGGSGNSSTIGSLFRGGAGGVLGPTVASGNSESVAERLTDGLLGGTVGLLAGLFRSLFRSNDKDSPSFTPFEKPGAIFFEYDIGTSAAPSPALNSTDAISDVSPQPAPNNPRARNPSPTVLVQVNALDAQSFSNRSDDIANAVREALSRNHTLRDEIWED